MTIAVERDVEPQFKKIWCKHHTTFLIISIGNGDLPLFGPKSGNISPKVASSEKWVKIYFVYYFNSSILYSYNFFVSLITLKHWPL